MTSQIAFVIGFSFAQRRISCSKKLWLKLVEAYGHVDRALPSAQDATHFVSAQDVTTDLAHVVMLSLRLYIRCLFRSL